MRRSAFLLLLVTIPTVQACGGDDQTITTVTGPSGTELTVRTDGTPKEQAISLLEALNQALDFDPSLEECMLERVSDLPESEFPDLSDASSDEAFTGSAELSARFSAECRPPDGQVIEEEPSEGTVAFLRFTLGRALEIQAMSRGAAPGVAECARRVSERFPESALLELLRRAGHPAGLHPRDASAMHVMP